MRRCTAPPQASRSRQIREKTVRPEVGLAGVLPLMRHVVDDHHERQAVDDQVIEHPHQSIELCAEVGDGVKG